MVIAQHCATCGGVESGQGTRQRLAEDADEEGPNDAREHGAERDGEHQPLRTCAENAAGLSERVCARQSEATRVV